MHRGLDLLAIRLGLLERLQNGGIAADFGIALALLVAAGLVGGTKRRFAVEPFPGRHGLNERLVVADDVGGAERLFRPAMVVRPLVHIVHVAAVRAELVSKPARHLVVRKYGVDANSASNGCRRHGGEVDQVAEYAGAGEPDDLVWGRLDVEG